MRAEARMEKKCPGWTMQRMILNLTERPYAATYSSSQAKKKTLMGERGMSHPEPFASNSRPRANDCCGANPENLAARIGDS